MVSFKECVLADFLESDRGSLNIDLEYKLLWYLTKYWGLIDFLVFSAHFYQDIGGFFETEIDYFQKMLGDFLIEIFAFAGRFFRVDFSFLSLVGHLDFHWVHFLSKNKTHPLTLPLPNSLTLYNKIYPLIKKVTEFY